MTGMKKMPPPMTLEMTMAARVERTEAPLERDHVRRGWRDGGADGHAATAVRTLRAE